jgi:alpha-galactosidase
MRDSNGRCNNRESAMRNPRPPTIAYCPTIWLFSLAVFIGSLSFAAAGVSDTNTFPQTFRVGTDAFALRFEVGRDGRLYQRALGDTNEKLGRDDEAYPQSGDGYVWEPALQVVHADGNTSTELKFTGLFRTNDNSGSELVRINLRDTAYDFEVALCFQSHRPGGVIEQWAEITHHESGPVMLQKMASTSLRVGKGVYLTHFFGDWAKEMMSPITEKLTPGTKSIDSKLGVRATQYQSTSFMLSFDGPPQEKRGRVLIGSLAWSGNFQCEFDDYGRSVRAVCGINPQTTTYQLPPGQIFVTPRMIWSWSTNGAGDASRNLHAWARDFGLRDGHKLRAVLLNNWEATGFDFDFQRITSLFDPAKEVGAELFLLDDGWFGNKYPRINDRAGLGDWQPNHERLPQGVGPLAAEAVKRGLRFGIWLEPEMVNPKSELFEQHPDWIIRQPKRELDFWRNQLVLDLVRPEVQDFEWQSLQSILEVPGVSFVKWDCNRHVSQPGSSWLPADRQGEIWIDYVHALYGLMAKTAAKFPETEMMLCSGGGGRADYGALPYFHEFWPTDNTDPVARVCMQWNYSYFFPAISMAAHVTHAGKRPMHFACCVAMSECFGMDLDLVKLSSDNRNVLTEAVQAYKKIRDVVQLGDLYRLEDPNSSDRGALNYVSADQTRAVLFVFQMRNQSHAPVRPEGISPEKSYLVHELNPAPGREKLKQEGQIISGAKILQEGIEPSCHNTTEACVVELTATSAKQ